MGQHFKGVFSIFEKNLKLFKPHGKQDEEDTIEIASVNDPLLEKIVGIQDAKTLREEVKLIEEVYPAFEREDYLLGMISPVFFGSAINNFGVRELLDCFIQIAPQPLPRQAEERIIEPNEAGFSGFIFKIHANMDPNHRDRIAFLRICSGIFHRNTNYLHVRQNRKLKFSNPTSFMAAKKTIVEEAFPGDVIGLYDSGNFKIGDTLTEGEVLHFKGIPRFSPEMFRYVNNVDPLKTKQLAKGLDQLMDEGVAQLFTKEFDGRKLIGTVGALQFDVIQYRLLHEYGASVQFEPVNLYKACWISAEKDSDLQSFLQRRKRDLAKDKSGKWVYLAESPWALKLLQENNPEIIFHFISEFE
jgi:peptide chain release factor 3